MIQSLAIGLGQAVGFAGDEGERGRVVRVVLDVGRDFRRQVVLRARPASSSAASFSRSASMSGAIRTCVSRLSSISVMSRPMASQASAQQANAARSSRQATRASCSSPARSGRRRPVRPARPRRTRAAGAAAAGVSGSQMASVTCQVLPSKVSGPSRVAQSARISSVASYEVVQAVRHLLVPGQAVVDVLPALVAGIQEVDHAPAGESGRAWRPSWRSAPGAGSSGPCGSCPASAAWWRRPAPRAPSTPPGSPRPCPASGGRPPTASRSPAPRRRARTAAPSPGRAWRCPACERAGCRGRQRWAGRRRIG